MDSTTLNSILQFLNNGGGWLPIVVGVLTAGLLIWWAIYKHKILIDVAQKQTESQRDQTEIDEAQKTKTQDQVDSSGRKDTDNFLSGSQPK